MTTEVPDISQTNAISFEEMAFCIGLFHFSEDDAYCFNAYKFDAKIHAHTVVCFLPGHHNNCKVLFAWIVQDGKFWSILGYLEADMIPKKAAEYMVGSLYNIVASDGVTFEQHLQYDGVCKLKYIGSMYWRVLVTWTELQTMQE